MLKIVLLVTSLHITLSAVGYAGFSTWRTWVVDKNANTQGVSLLIQQLF
jgi:hypothetical protein